MVVLQNVLSTVMLNNVKLSNGNVRLHLATLNQIFTLRQIMEKRHESQDKTHHLFVDFKAAFDSPLRDTAMSELGISAKLIKLCRMMLSNSCSSIKVGKDLSEPFDTV